MSCQSCGPGNMCDCYAPEGDGWRPSPLVIVAAILFSPVLVPLALAGLAREAWRKRRARL